jgi:hypothetical protein
MLAVTEEAEAVVNIAMVERMGATWRVIPISPRRRLELRSQITSPVIKLWSQSGAINPPTVNMWLRHLDLGRCPLIFIAPIQTDKVLFNYEIERVLGSQTGVLKGERVAETINLRRMRPRGLRPS